MLAQDIVDGGQAHRRKRIEQFIGSWNAHLDEAKLFGIGVKTVCFGIQGDPFGGTKPRKKIFELLIRIDHAGI